MKKIYIFCLIFTLFGCKPFYQGETYNFEYKVRLSELKQVDCVNDISLEESRDKNFFYWSCDFIKGSEKGVFFNDYGYLLYDFKAEYDSESEILDIYVYSNNISNLFENKEDMINSVSKDVINILKKIQPAIDNQKIADIKKEKFEKSFYD